MSFTFDYYIVEKNREWVANWIVSVVDFLKQQTLV